MSTPPSGTVTFLFTDIEGSTRLAREHSETWETLRARHHQILRESIASHNGFIFQVIGDAFCAAFHKAGDALKAAVQAQQALQTENWRECVIRVRMGIHTGEAEARNGEYEGYLTLSLVQRIMSAGHGGQVLVSGATENLLRGQPLKDSQLRDMGVHTFKDVPNPTRVFQVTAPGLQDDFPSLRVLDIVPNNLPSQLTSFIGREKEVADVKSLLQNTRLLTLVGPGGTGKTRLSLQVAMEMLPVYPHGVWFIELAPVSDPSSVPAAVLSALNLPAESHRPAIEMLCHYLREKEALLILDNCEHLIDSCARMVDRLLHASPRLRILSSSREALGVAGEVSYRVPSLGLPDLKDLPPIESLSQYEAVRLFIDRARAAQPSFHVTNDNAPAVAQICHRLDGIPLALELAAVKVRALSVEQIAKRLDDQLRLLTGGSRTALERHQTLRATLDWSHNLLPPAEQILFRRLSIFVNGWTLEATESICADESLHTEDIFDVLDQLVNKSLVSTESWHTEVRYRILETVRQYAGEKLVNAGESESLRDKHLGYFRDLAETAEPHLIRPEQLEWLDRLEADHDNLRLALEWALGKESAELALRLCAAMGMFWYIHCHWKEGTRWLEKALTRPSQELDQSEKIARARGFYQDAQLAHQLDDVERSRLSAETSLTLCQETGQRRDIAIARAYLGLVVKRGNDEKSAYRLWEESLADFRALQDSYWEARTQFFLLEWDVDTQNEAQLLSVNLARKAGERVLLAETLVHKLNSAWLLGQLEEAEQYLGEIETLHKQAGYTGGEELIYRGLIAHYRNNYSQAKFMYMACIERRGLLGEKEMRAVAVQYLGLLARDEGDLHTAQTYLEQALEVARFFRRKRVIVRLLALLGQILFLQGEVKSAKKNFAESLSLEVERKASSPYFIPLILVCSLFADLIPSVAAKILSCLNKQKPFQPEMPLIRRDLERIISKIQTRLNESVFNLTWAEGETMTMDQALDLARKTLDEI